MLYDFFWVIPRRLNFICRRFGTLWLFHLKNGQVWECWGITPTFSNLVIPHTYPSMKMEQSVPKRRYIKFRRRGITQKKAYSIQNKAKGWNQEYCNSILIYKTWKLQVTNTSTFVSTFDHVHYTYPTCLTYCIGADAGWTNCTGSYEKIIIFFFF
jgi:hypothetical protein